MTSFKDKQVFTSNGSFCVRYRIKEVVQPRPSLYLVLYDPSEYTSPFGQFPNAEAFDEKGMRLWTAELPTNESGDCFEEIVSSTPLVLQSWKSYDCELDLDSGKIIRRTFYK